MQEYNAIRRKRIIYFTVITFLLVIFLILGMITGSGIISVADLGNIFTGKGSELQEKILFSIRLPRLFAAVLSGLALAVSGTIMQSVLRNALGSPFTLGMSNAAAFGASLAIMMPSIVNFVPSGIAQQIVIPLSAFAWSLSGCFFILFLSRQQGASPVVMVLGGIIVSPLFAALTSGLQFFADDSKLASIVYWHFGDLSKGTLHDVFVQALVILPLCLYFTANARHYNALNQGDDIAQSLGVNVKRFRLTSMIMASLITSVVVSVYGIIAFVGLVIPHIVRRLIGGNEIFLIPGTALTGAVFLLACDIISRTIISPIALPVGIVTSVIGAPVFIVLMLKSKSFYLWRS
ncbi:MAG TPA: iron ABC transporter permease [Niabella sp.]|nr:iron ABC transporter permease [Niabella sp.]